MQPKPSEKLVIDLSPAPARSEEDVRHWASGQEVFISSVMGGMGGERRAAVAGVETVGGRPVWFENFGGMDDDPEQAYLGQVASSSIYLGILGPRYGIPLKSGYSATHAEYNEAVRAGLRISVWTAPDGLDGHQNDFLGEVRVFHTTGTYASPQDLQSRVEARLRIMANEALSPWVKIGPVLVRATSISSNGREIVVTARIRDGEVAHVLEQMRPGDAFGRRTETRITWPGGTEPVRITDVSSETTNALTQELRVTAEVTERKPTSPLMGMTVNGHSPEELTEIALRSAFFGEDNPLGRMSFAAEAINPLPQLGGLRLAEDAYEQVARLLVVEEVVGRLGAARVIEFRLGPPVQGVRRMRLGWLAPRVYSNVEPGRRVIDGDVR